MSLFRCPICGAPLTREGRTYTNLERLDRKQRREELARLIGGAAVTPALLESAEELLAQADAWREKHKK